MTWMAASSNRQDRYTRRETPPCGLGQIQPDCDTAAWRRGVSVHGTRHQTTKSVAGLVFAVLH
jgi:hypothetical protein